MAGVLRVLVAVAGLLLVLSACSADPSTSSTEGGGKVGATTTLTTGTCWTGATSGADPQEVLRTAERHDLSYFPVAHALEGRPSFALTAPCGGDHAIEVYKAVRMQDVKPQVDSYADVLAAGSPKYRALSANVERACMNQVLFDAVAKAGVRGAVMTPAFPNGFTLGWAPVSEEQWKNGQRAFACTLTQAKPSPLRYGAVFGRSFPTSKRTCIDGKALVYVDCARKHTREVISVIDVREAVLAGTFPGRKKIRTGPKGRYVDVSPAQYAALDRACTAFLRSVSTTKKLSGVAEIDADRWPADDGSYPVTCEADAPTTEESITTQGTVFNRL